MLGMRVFSWTSKQDGRMELRTCNTIIFRYFPTLDHRLAVVQENYEFCSTQNYKRL